MSLIWCTTTNILINEYDNELSFSSLKKNFTCENYRWRIILKTKFTFSVATGFHPILGGQIFGWTPSLFAFPFFVLSYFPWRSKKVKIFTLIFTISFAFFPIFDHSKQTLKYNGNFVNNRKDIIFIPFIHLLLFPFFSLPPFSSFFPACVSSWN